MSFNPVKVSLMAFAILFKILSAYCESFFKYIVQVNSMNYIETRRNTFQSYVSALSDLDCNDIKAMLSIRAMLFNAKCCAIFISVNQYFSG